MLYFVLIWLLLISVLLYVSYNLLFSLIVLEIITFVALFFVSVSVFSFSFSDYYLLLFFSMFVIEGVIGLSGMIILVFYSGSDYLSTSSIFKL